MRQIFAALLVIAGLAAHPGAARADTPIPPLKARVTDLTGTLNAQQKGELEARIAAYEARRGSQIAVLLLPTTKPEEIEQYSIRLAEAWKIGRRKVDDGLILVVAKDDRRLRIEVGYGLEGAIPDSIARRVIEERITPRFRDGDFYGGVRDGVDQLIRLAEGEKLPPASAAVGTTRSAPENLIDFIILVCVFAVMAGFFLKAVLGRFTGSVAAAAGIGLIGWLMFGIVVAVAAAVIGFILVFLNTGMGRSGRWSSGSGGSWGGSRGGSWGGSSGSSSSSWGGGGGGGFGGGGASGRW